MLNCVPLKLGQVLGSIRFEFIKNTQQSLNVWHLASLVKDSHPLIQSKSGQSVEDDPPVLESVQPVSPPIISKNRVKKPVLPRVRLKESEKKKLIEVYEEWCSAQFQRIHSSLSSTMQVDDFDPAAPLRSNQMSELIKLIGAALPDRDAKTIMRNLRYHRRDQNANFAARSHRDAPALIQRTTAACKNVETLLNMSPALTSLFTRIRVITIKLLVSLFCIYFDQIVVLRRARKKKNLKSSNIIFT